jgi:low-affinity ferrous iron transport protein
MLAPRYQSDHITISGALLKFSDNWVLIIGAFTGLVGFIDGFIIRRIYSIEETSAVIQFRALTFSDTKLLKVLNIPVHVQPIQNLSLLERISPVTSELCGHRYILVGPVLSAIRVTCHCFDLTVDRDWSIALQHPENDR